MTLKDLYAATAAIVQSKIRFGHNIYTEDWDALIILDACRVDALREVASEYEFLTDIESRWSRGSTSKEWLENTFVENHIDEIRSTTYVTANYYSTEMRENKLNRLNYPMCDGEFNNNKRFEEYISNDIALASDFGAFIDLFDKEIDEDELQLHPEVVTDHAVTAGRETDWSRMVIHYMQPHHPFLHSNDSPRWHREPFAYLNDGGDFDKVWQGYLDNLRLVLDSVRCLLKNLDAEKTIITADHGELFGEWGLSGHGVGIPHPSLRKVPWAHTSAYDSMEHTPKTSVPVNKLSKRAVEEQLEALGYQ